MAEPTPGDSVDDDTLQAVRTLWQTAGGQSLPALVTEPPKTGRLKSPETLSYAQATSELGKRELTGTGGAWYDDRKVTLKVWALKDDAVSVQKILVGIFNLQTTLVFPSGARFLRWWPDGGPKLSQDPTTKDGRDLWICELVATVRSVRSL